MTDGVPCTHHALQSLRDDREQLIAGRLPDLVVDILEPVDVDEQRARQHPRLALGSRDHARSAVHRERTVGEPGEGVIEILLGKLLLLLGALAGGDRRGCPSAAAAKDEEEQSEQGAHQDAGDQQGERACVRQHSPVDRGPEARDGPSVVQVGGAALSAPRERSAGEHTMRGADPLGEESRVAGVPPQRLAQHGSG